MMTRYANSLVGDSYYIPSGDYMKLTARFDYYSNTTKIHRSTCGCIPVTFNEKIDDVREVILKIVRDGEEITTKIKVYCEGEGWYTQWVEPLEPRVFVKAIPIIANTIRKDLGVSPSPCAKCKSYEVVNIRMKGDKWWLELKEDYK